MIKSWTALVLLVFSLPLCAHHSTTAYDHTRTIELKGTVKDFQWTNPHSWIQLLVTDGNGNTTEWAIETGAPNLNVRHGWKRDDLKPGDRVTLTAFPNRDGTPNASLTRVTLPDGRVLEGAAEFIPKDLQKQGVAAPPPSPQAGGANASPQAQRSEPVP